MAHLRRYTLRSIARPLMLAVAVGFLVATVGPGLAQEATSPAAAQAEPMVTAEPTPVAQLSKAEARIQDALDSPTEVDFVETPLTDVATFLAQLHNIPVRVDVPALEDAAIPSDLPVTFQVRGIKLRSALKLMFHKWDLGFHYRNEALEITTAESWSLDLLRGSIPLTTCWAKTLTATAKNGRRLFNPRSYPTPGTGFSGQTTSRSTAAGWWSFKTRKFNARSKHF